MATRKRKSPDRRRPAKQPAFASRALFAAGGAAGGALLRHPKPVLGGAAFIVLFSFVAANALWYQHGGHPAPFLATRDPRDPNAIAGYRSITQPAPEDVTTFRIERAAANAPVSASANAQPNSQASAAAFPASQTAQPMVAQPMPGRQASAPYAPIIPAPATETAAVELSGKDLIAEIQRQLASRGLYDGADDGLTGPRTQAAIMAFEQGRGLAAKGEPTPAVLAELRADPADVAAAAQGAAAAPLHVASVPTPVAAPRAAEPARQPLPNTARAEPRQKQPPMQPATVQSATARSAALKGDDPVAAAIRSSERSPYTVPPADIPAARSLRPAAQPISQTMPQRQASASGASSTDLVLQIQRGLANIAYADVQITGFATPETKEAIRRFERHYRLPETGEPNVAVLKKLKAIGAL